MSTNFGTALTEVYNWYCRKRDELQALCDGGPYLSNATTSIIYPKIFRGRTANGTTEDFGDSVTMTRTAVGRWQVRFDTPHPDGADYTPSFAAEEQDNLRDTPDLTIVQGTQNTNGFDIQITTGDNGGTADAYVDTPWSFSVEGPVTVVTGVS